MQVGVYAIGCAVAILGSTTGLQAGVRASTVRWVLRNWGET